MNALRDIALLVAKDLRIEARDRGTLPLLSVLGVLFVTVLGLGLAAAGGARTHAGAVLWASYMFGGTLCFEKTMAVDQRDDALAALLLSPVDRGSLYFAKLITNFILLVIIAAAVTASAALFLGMEVSVTPVAFVRIVVLGLAGFAAVGTLLSGAAAFTRMHPGLLTVVILPLCMPLVLASTSLLNDSRGQVWGGLGESVLVAFDAVFIAAGWLTFDLLLEM